MATADRYEPAPTGHRSVLRTFVAESRAVDLALIALVPIALLLVFALPLELREAYLLAYREPTIPTAFASHFVHLRTGHLAANLLGYGVVVSVAYSLSLSGGRRREFLVAFVTFLLAFPFVLSALDVLFARPRLGYGFSGIVMAFLGFLPLPLLWHLEARFDASLDADHSPVLFFFGMAAIAAWAAPLTLPNLAVLVLAVGAGTVYLRSLRADVGGSLLASLRAAAENTGHFEFALGGLVLFALFPFAAFPPDPVGAGTVLNLYTHLLGYAFGYIAPYTSFLLLGGSLE